MGICYHTAFSKPLPRNPIYSNMSSRSRQDYLIVERFHNTSPSRIIVIVLIMRQQWLGRTSTGNAGRLINAGWVKMVTTLQLRSDEDRKKVPKILIAGQFKLILCHFMPWILKSYLDIQTRYGNPDMQILGTLKIKIQVYGFFNMPSKNMGSKLIFRFAINL